MEKARFLILIIGICLIWCPGYSQDIDWQPLSKAQELAAQNGKKVMIFAEAEWCGYCQKMYKKVFPQQSVQDSLSKYFYPVRVDIESDSKITFNGETYTQKNFSRKFRVSSTPTLIFLNSDGKVIGRQPGYLPANIFDKLVAFVGSDMTGKMPFKKYLQRHGVDINR